VAWSRVWLGIHWTTDVVASVLVAVVLLAWAETLVEQRHTPRPEPPPTPGSGPAGAEMVDDGRPPLLVTSAIIARRYRS
jgi:predicted metal-binding membrane protein